MKIISLSLNQYPSQLESSIAFQGTRGESFRLNMLEEWLVRVTFCPEGTPRLNRTWMVQGTCAGADDPVPREGRDRNDLSVFSCPEASVSLGMEQSEVSTGLITVTVDGATGALRWRDSSGFVFARDLPDRAYCYDRAGGSVFHYMVRSSSELYYGFGERAGPLNKHGMRMRMCNLDALGYDAARTDPLYKHWPIYIVYQPEQSLSYAIIYDNVADTVFDMGMEIDAYHGDYRVYNALHGDVDYYLVFGPTLKEVVKRISLLIGRIGLPPRWSLGYLGSGMGYTDSSTAALRLDDFVHKCEENRMPCDMFHLSSGYSMSEEGRRHVFVWNRERVPDPSRVAAAFHRVGMKVCANIKPCLLLTHPEYQKGVDNRLFITDEEGPHVTAFWGGKGSYIDFTSPQGYQWWKDHVRKDLLDYGIDGTWNDNNEFEVWDDDARCDGFGEALSAAMVRPVQTLLMTRASWEAQTEATPTARPYVLCRSGMPGIQRYAQSWSGDNSTSWESLKYNVPMGLGLSLTGQPNTGHDVGGFWGEVPDPELLVRWIQNGIFHPRFSIHSWRLDGTATEPWMYPDVVDIVRDTILFRYRLVPYLYNLFVIAAEQGEPIIRPMVYEFPDDSRCHEESFDFLLGPSMLVVSVFEPGLRERNVYLPRGAQWCDWFTGEWYDGGEEYTIATPLDRPTVLVRSGAIIPVGKPMNRIDPALDDRRELYLFPFPAGDSRDRKDRTAVRIFDDDGETLAYQHGARKVTEVVMTSGVSDITIEAKRVHDGYDPKYDQFEIVLPEREKRPLRGPGVQTIESAKSQRHRYSIPLVSLSP